MKIRPPVPVNPGKAMPVTPDAMQAPCAACKSVNPQELRALQLIEGTRMMLCVKAAPCIARSKAAGTWKNV
jgi:hypothetical protein